MAFLFTQPVLFKHCDPAGIVFYPRYFEMINDCVEAFFDEALAHPFHELHKTGAVPTGQISARFSAPSRHGDRLEFRLTPTRLGTSSLDLDIRTTCGEELRLRCQSTLVHIKPTGRAAPWPYPLRATLTPLIGEPI